MTAPPGGPPLQTAATVARVLDVAERTVWQLAREGKIPRAGRGGYDLMACVRAYIRHLREIAAGRSAQDGTSDLVIERARLAKEQADGHAMKNAVMREELVVASEIEAATVKIHSAVQRRILAVPKSCAPLLAIESEARVCEAILRSHLEEALQEIADAEIVVVPPAGGGGDDPHFLDG